jgi:hypothetical protein
MEDISVNVKYMKQGIRLNVFVYLDRRTHQVTSVRMAGDMLDVTSAIREHDPKHLEFLRQRALQRLRRAGEV